MCTPKVQDDAEIVFKGIRSTCSGEHGGKYYQRRWGVEVIPLVLEHSGPWVLDDLEHTDRQTTTHPCSIQSPLLTC